MATELDSLFREAVTHVDGGDAPALARMLREHQRLVRERLDTPGEWLREQVGGALDGFFKDPYLLWFVAEDPVRNETLSSNVGDVARTIIEAATREGVESLQEQIDYALHLAVCSPVGRTDGSQRALIDALVDAGALGNATPEKARGAPLQALICHNAAAAEQLLARGAPLSLGAAVCLDRWDDLPRLAREATHAEKQMSLSLAALNGRARGIAALLEMGVDIDDYATGFYTHATPLHHAVCSGELAAVKVLVEAGAKLDTKDTAWGHTPLGWADYYRRENAADARAADYAEIARYLEGKGAGCASATSKG
jgi:peptide-methionine (S)-S-oxide reductase